MFEKDNRFGDKVSALFNKLRKKDVNTAPVKIVFGESVKRPVTVLELPRELDLAARTGDYDLVKDLLDQGADPNLVSHFSGPALNEATEYADTTIMQLLIDNGADVNKANLADVPPLHRAIMAWKDGEAKLRLLLDAGADVTAKDCHGDSALDKARRHDKTEMVQILEAHIKKSGLKPDRKSGPAKPSR